MSRRISPRRALALRHLARNLALLGVGGLMSACATGTDAGDERQAFIERLGTDTMSVELYTRMEAGFEGQLLIRAPATRVAQYQATLAPDGTIGNMHVSWSTPPENPDGPPPVEQTITVQGDSATIETVGGRNPGTTRVAVPEGVIPTVGKTPIAFAVLEQALSQAMAAGADSFPVSFLSAGRGRVQPNAIVRVAMDSIAFSFFGNPFLARVDEGGRVLGRSGERTTLKLVGEKVGDLDFEALAADFAARDARGEGIGVPSPEATVEAAVGGANISIVYSRPAKRGREIWGNLAPLNEVWRTGANAATEFSTDRDLDIGDALVPAGTYTLFSIYTPESTHLIINQQTGQWGTQYDQAQDLARVELVRATLSQPVERFTIAIEPTDDGGELQLIWDTTRFSVPVKVR
jgi:hypothetical protein